MDFCIYLCTCIPECFAGVSVWAHMTANIESAVAHLQFNEGDALQNGHILLSVPLWSGLLEMVARLLRRHKSGHNSFCP